jgi:hypothetical protein
VLRAAKETGYLVQGTNNERVTTTVDLIDDYKSDGDSNESNTSSLLNPE